MILTKPAFQIPPNLFNTVYNLPLSHKILILILAWGVPIVLFWFFFFSPRLGELSTLSKQIPQLKQEIARLEAKERQLPQMEEELKIMEEILGKAVRLLPEKKDIPSVLTEISSLGNAAHLEFVSFEPQKEQIKDFYVAIPVKILIKGPFHNTVSFFDKLSRMGRIVHVKEFSMDKAEESTQIWSQSGGEAASKGASSMQDNSASTLQQDSKGAEKSVRGGTWVITTDCTVETYRFLTDEEQKQRKKQNNKKKGKKTRRKKRNK